MSGKHASGSLRRLAVQEVRLGRDLRARGPHRVLISDLP
jgi:hypothetical protein